MVKNHLKRIATPRTWNILRKTNTFITRPNAGAHKHTHATSLNTLVKETLGLAKTTKEVKRMLHDKNVQVDGRKRHDERFNVGFMDVISFPADKQAYRIVFSAKGKLAAVKIDEKETAQKVCRIVAKYVVAGGKTKLTLHDGRTLAAEKASDYKVGDSVLITLPDQKISTVYPLAKGASAVVYEGHYTGATGTVEAVEGQSVIIKTKDGQIHTKRSYAFVTGDKQPAITCSP